MSYPPPPPGIPPAGVPGKPRLRGRIPLRLGIIFLVLGIVGIVAGGIVALNGGSKKVDSFTRMDIPTGTQVSTKKIDFGGTGGFIAYYESGNANSSGVPPVIPVELVSPTGSEQILDTPYGGESGGRKIKSLAYDYNGHKGVALWQFTVNETGAYTVRVGGSTSAQAGSKIAFGRSIGKSTAVGGVLIILGFLFLIAGIVLLIIGIVKRGHSKKELARAAQAYPQPGYGPPGPYTSAGGYGPPSQYPPPGYPQQGARPGYSSPIQPSYPPQHGYPPPGYSPPGYQPGYQPGGGEQAYPPPGYTAPPSEPAPDDPWPPKEPPNEPPKQP